MTPFRWISNGEPGTVRAWFVERAGEAGWNESESGTGVEVCCSFDETVPHDGFRITDDGTRITIAGRRLRAWLYGCSEVVSALTGVRRFDGLAAPYRRPVVQRPLTIERRPACVDRLMRDHASLQPDQIPVLLDNGFNGLSFNPIHVLGDSPVALPLIREAERLDVDVTVGGHIVSQLVPADRWFQPHPEYFPLVDGERRPSGHLCLANTDAAMLLRDRIVDCAGELSAVSPAIRRFSVWSEDSAVVCECPACRERPFNEMLAAIVERAGEAAAARGIPIRLEHIVYNALGGRSRDEAFNTLRPPRELHEGADCLFAYWGRNYALPLDAADNEYDRRGRALLGEAAERCRRGCTALNLFEYYPDMWQLGDMFPFLGPVIWADAHTLRRLGIHGVWLCLADCPLGMDSYPVRELELLNIVFSGRALWDPLIPYEEFLKDYLAAMAGDRSAAVRRMLEGLTAALAPLTLLNLRHPVPGLSGARLWRLATPLETFQFDPDDARQSAVAPLHRELYENAETLLAAMESDIRILQEQRGIAGVLARHASYCTHRVRSVLAHLRCQEAMRTGDSSAATWLEQGFRDDRNIGSLLAKEYDEWQRARRGESLPAPTPENA